MSKANGVQRMPFEYLFQQWSPNTPTTTDLVNQKIRYYAPQGKPQSDFVQAEVQAWLNSPERKFLEVAEKYYENENDINNYIRYTFNGRGNKVKSKLSNTKRSHAFFRDLVDQRVRYLLSKPFSITTEDNARGKAYEAELVPYFTNEFRRRFKNTGKAATIDGLCWIQVAYSSTGKLVFTRIPRKECIPFWADADHTILDALIRVYDMTVYDGQKDKHIQKIQFWTREGVWYYEIDADGKFHQEEDAEGNIITHPHFYAEPEEDEEEESDVLIEEDGVEVRAGMLWDRIPFVCFKSCGDEISLLNLVKSLIDEYDRTSSDLGNSEKDQPESIKIVKNYSGTNPEEFLQKLADYRTAFVDENGDVHTITDAINFAGIYQDLTEIRKNIYHFGNGVDYSVTNFGNATGVGLKFLYGKLDAAAMDMADEFQASFEQLRWFINRDIELRGGENYDDVQADIVFNVDQIINESETISNVNASKGVISDRTAIENHPWVKDVDKELEAIKAQETAELQRLIDKYGLPGTDDTPPDDATAQDEEE